MWVISSSFCVCISQPVMYKEGVDENERWRQQTWIRYAPFADEPKKVRSSFLVSFCFVHLLISVSPGDPLDKMTSSVLKSFIDISFTKDVKGTNGHRWLVSISIQTV